MSAYEERRQQALRNLKILETPSEERYDRMIRALAEELGVPIAYLSLVDERRQWLKSVVGGLDVETEREETFCHHTIQGEGPLVVPDATRDPRFQNLRFVTGEQGLRFYAGVPITDPNGFKVGTVCVADRAERQLDSSQEKVLEQFAMRVQAELQAKPTVFISYAHEDEAWKDRILTHCRVLQRQGLLEIWEDRRIRTGTDWERDIQVAIERSQVAVLLVSAHFLASEFIMGEEVPRLLQRRDGEGLRILPALLSPCLWEEEQWLRALNFWPRDAQPMSAQEGQADRLLSELAAEIAQTIRERGRALTRAEASSDTSEPLEVSPVTLSSDALLSSEALRAETSAGAPTERTVPARDGEGRERLESFGKYRLLERLNAGTLREVYRAEDTSLGRPVTIKVLSRARDHDPQERERFQREARILAALNHPYIATLHSLEEVNGAQFLVLEAVSGETVTQRLERGPLPVGTALLVGFRLASAIVAAHTRGVVLRDLDPSNVMVTDAGDVKVLDFGIAKQLSAQASPVSRELPALEACSPFLSPERLRGQGVDIRSDVWAFGGILFALLSGRSPFEGPTPIDTLTAIMTRDPAWNHLPPRTPEPVWNVLERCLKKQPTERFAHMTEVEQALQTAKPSFAPGSD